jgi:hypothetical protein
VASTINWIKSTATLLTTQLVTTATIVAGAALGMTGKDAVNVAVRFGRTTTLTQGATVFTIEQSPSGGAQGNDWVPVVTWTTALSNSIVSATTLSADMAASATTLKAVATATNYNSTPLFIYNSASPALSEWNWAVGPFGTATTLLNPTGGPQTAAAVVLTNYGEMWNIQLDVHALNAIRLTVNTTWNALTVPVVVQATVVAADGLSAT